MTMVPSQCFYYLFILSDNVQYIISTLSRTHVPSYVYIYPFANIYSLIYEYLPSYKYISLIFKNLLSHSLRSPAAAAAQGPAKGVMGVTHQEAVRYT